MFLVHCIKQCCGWNTWSFWFNFKIEFNFVLIVIFDVWLSFHNIDDWNSEFLRLIHLFLNISIPMVSLCHSIDRYDTPLQWELIAARNLLEILYNQSLYLFVFCIVLGSSFAGYLDWKISPQQLRSSWSWLVSVTPHHPSSSTSSRCFSKSITVYMKN